MDAKKQWIQVIKNHPAEEVAELIIRDGEVVQNLRENILKANQIIDDYLEKVEYINPEAVLKKIKRTLNKEKTSNECKRNV